VIPAGGMKGGGLESALGVLLGGREDIKQGYSRIGPYAGVSYEISEES